MGNSNSLTSQEVKKSIGKFDLILDVRTQDEWNDGHYPSAIHIPIDRLDKKFSKIYPDKNFHILIYCKSGNRASKAQSILDGLGYKNVYYLLDDGYSSLL